MEELHTTKVVQNEMMDRPVVEAGVLNFMRTGQADFPGPLKELEEYAHENRVPVIPHETAIFLDFLLDIKKPKRILEIGMAIGFSGSLMVYGHEERTLDTIDRYDKMIVAAKENFEKLGVADRVTIHEGDAKDVLPTLTDQYDFALLDSAKAKYFDFFSLIMDRLQIGGVLMIDDIFQGGTVFNDLETIPKRVRKIHKKLNLLLDEVVKHPNLKTSILPLGDGVLLVEKIDDTDFSYLLEKNF
ncbi:MAG: methyltransferase [Aerococcus viridans]|nr:MAG: methyltransferase [Aerococcus viridans]